MGLCTSFAQQRAESDSMLCWCKIGLLTIIPSQLSFLQHKVPRVNLPATLQGFVHEAATNEVVFGAFSNVAMNDATHLKKMPLSSFLVTSVVRNPRSVHPPHHSWWMKSLYFDIVDKEFIYCTEPRTQTFSLLNKRVKVALCWHILFLYFYVLIFILE